MLSLTVFLNGLHQWFCAVLELAGLATTFFMFCSFFFQLVPFLLLINRNWCLSVPGSHLGHAVRQLLVIHGHALGLVQRHEGPLQEQLQRGRGMERGLSASSWTASIRAGAVQEER